MKRGLGLALIALLAMPSLAFADCIYDGQTYPEGARIGVLVCEGGQWVARP